MARCIVIIISLFLLSSCKKNEAVEFKNRVMVTSVSSDGRYAITTHSNKHAYLWNLEKKTYQILPYKNVNVYSAYFIRNSHQYMIQLNDTNKVIIENIDGTKVKEFSPGFPSYGQIISQDLKHYVASDDNYNVFSILNGKKQKVLGYYCPPDQPKNNPPKQKELEIYGCMSFMAAGKLMNLSFTPDEKEIIGTDYGYMYLWNGETGKLQKKIQQTSGQTVNAISPDGKYVVVGDQQRGAFLYDLKKQAIISNQYGTRFAINTPALTSAENYFYDIYPGGEKRRNRNGPDELTTIKFIDQDHYVASFASVPYAFNYLGLYNAKDITKIVVSNITSAQARPIKYLPLIDEKNITPNTMFPETRSFVRDQAMDTSPSAHVLVMGQANGGGIMVYRYDPESQELKLDWAPRLIPE